MGTKVVWWGHVRWDDDSAHGEAVVSPAFVTQEELRQWTKDMRMAHSVKAGFELSAFRRSIPLDAKGSPIEGFPDDTSLRTADMRPSRERHMQFVAELAEILKAVEKPLLTKTRLAESA